MRNSWRQKEHEDLLRAHTDHDYIDLVQEPAWSLCPERRN